MGYYPPREAISRRKRMNPVETLLHVFMCICTIGLWYPVYRARKRSTDRTVTTYR